MPLMPPMRGEVGRSQGTQELGKKPMCGHRGFYFLG